MACYPVTRNNYYLSNEEEKPLSTDLNCGPNYTFHLSALGLYIESPRSVQQPTLVIRHEIPR